MVVATAEWGSYSGWTGSRTVANAREAVALCESIEEHADAGAVLVGFTSESGHFFAIGLGADASCAMYWESVDPPYFQSRGSSEPDRPLDFAYSGQQTQLPGTVRIPRSDALRALSEFMEKDTRPESVAWDAT